MMSALILLLALDDKPVDVVCPVDGFKFKAFNVGYHPAWEGIDRDFCSHASRQVPLELKVWVCPSCCYTGFKADFDAKLSDESIKLFKGNLKPLTPIAKNVNQKNIPGTTKCDLLAQVRILRGDPPAEIAKAYLYSAWVLRQHGTVFLDGFEEFEELYRRQGLDKNPLEMKGQNKTELDLKVAAKIEAELKARPPKDLPLMLNRYLALYLCRKHGENVRALRWIEVLEGVKGENSVVDQAVQTAKKSIEEERLHQKKAVEQFVKAAEAAKGSVKAQAETEYIIGELYRRLGEREPAAQWLQKVIDRETADLKDIVKLAREQKALLDLDFK